VEKGKNDRLYGGNGYLTNPPTFSLPNIAYTGSPYTNQRMGLKQMPPLIQPGTEKLIASFPYFFLQPNQRKNILQ